MQLCHCNSSSFFPLTGHTLINGIPEHFTWRYNIFYLHVRRTIIFIFHQQDYFFVFIIFSNLVLLIGWWLITSPSFTIQNVPKAHGTFWTSLTSFISTRFALIFIFSAVFMIASTFFTE